MDDGTEVVTSNGNALFIPPGHRALVVGDESCVLIDWETEPSFRPPRGHPVRADLVRVIVKRGFARY